MKGRVVSGCSSCALADFRKVRGPGVFDGLPGHGTGKDAGEHAGYVGQHEQGECKRVQYFLPARRIDALPLRNGRERADSKHCQVHAVEYADRRTDDDGGVLPRDYATQSRLR